jgi:hypothetical protein
MLFETSSITNHYDLLQFGAGLLSLCINFLPLTRVILAKC